MALVTVAAARVREMEGMEKARVLAVVVKGVVVVAVVLAEAATATAAVARALVAKVASKAQVAMETRGRLPAVRPLQVQSVSQALGY